MVYENHAQFANACYERGKDGLSVALCALRNLMNCNCAIGKITMKAKP